MFFGEFSSFLLSRSAVKLCTSFYFCKKGVFPFEYLLVIVTVIELEAIVALYNKSLKAISYVCFEHVQCTVYS